MVYFVVCIALVWLLVVLRVVLSVVFMPRLSQQATPKDATDVRPRVSVIVAARNEEARLEEAVHGFFAQRGVDLDLVVVDDRSTDRTPAVLARLAERYPQLQIIRVECLPDGWLGKCHACWQGASRATAPWLLFTDADVHMVDDMIARAVATAEYQQACHLTAWPALNCVKPVTRGIVLGWSQCLGIFLSASEINRDRGRRGVGVGAFNLIRREAYDAVGGHRALALEVVDDLMLGMLVRRHGFRQRVYSAADLMEVEWAHSIWDTARAVEKNWFAAMRYRVLQALASISLLLFFIAAAWIAPFLDPRWGWLALVAHGLTILPGIYQARQGDWPLHVALFVPLGYLMMPVAGAHSLWKTLRQGGVRWRDTFYPLAELRAGMVR